MAPSILTSTARQARENRTRAVSDLSANRDRSSGPQIVNGPHLRLIVPNDEAVADPFACHPIEDQR